jgi:hypothetical protein
VAKLGGAVALTFEDRGNRGVIGIDDFAVGQFLALGEALAALLTRIWLPIAVPRPPSPSGSATPNSSA